MRSIMSTCLVALLFGSAVPANARVPHGGGHHAHLGSGHRGARGAARNAATYEVLEATNITDRTAFDQAMTKLSSTLSSHGGSVLADADTANDAGGGTPSGHTTIIMFDQFQSSDDWEKSADFQSLSTSIQKTASINLVRLGGIRPASPSEPAPAATSGGGDLDQSGTQTRQNAREPKMIKIPDICRGC